MKLPITAPTISTTMSTHHRQDLVAARSLMNREPSPLQRQVDGRTAFESASNAEEFPTLVNILAYRIERAPKNPVPCTGIVSVMLEQAAHIQELEQNFECIKEADDKQHRQDRHRQGHRERNHDEPCHHRPRHYSEEPSSQSDDRPWENKRVPD